jgi:hypothetical protein
MFGATTPGEKLPVIIARSAGQPPVGHIHTPSGVDYDWFWDYAEMPVGPRSAF